MAAKQVNVTGSLEGLVKFDSMGRRIRSPEVIKAEQVQRAAERASREAARAARGLKNPGPKAGWKAAAPKPVPVETDDTDAEPYRLPTTGYWAPGTTTDDLVESLKIAGLVKLPGATRPPE